MNSDELGNGKLPNRILEAVSEMEISVDEMLEWERTKPDFHASITDGSVRIEVRKRYSLRKLITVVTAVSGAAATIIKFVAPYFA
jgi:hypothetical protein